jgi:acetyl esterase/lipase
MIQAVNYRLAPASKHPSQIFQAYSAYVHLRELGYDDIFIGGDSAGANLALALWYYLHEIVNASDSVIGLVLHSVSQHPPFNP